MFFLLFIYLQFRDLEIENIINKKAKITIITRKYTRTIKDLLTSF